MIWCIVDFSIFTKDKSLRASVSNSRSSYDVFCIISGTLHRELRLVIEKSDSIIAMWISYPFCYSIKRRLNINCRREFHTCLRINIIDARNFRTRNWWRFANRLNSPGQNSYPDTEAEIKKDYVALSNGEAGSYESGLSIASLLPYETVRVISLSRGFHKKL